MNPLEDILSSVTLTALHAECPQGYYMVDLLLVRAIVEPHALLRRERDLVDALSDLPELVALVEENNPDELCLPRLTRILGGQDVAFKTMAALLTLRRANLMTLLNINEVMPEVLPPDWEPPTLERAVAAAERGFLSLLDINLHPDPATIGRSDDA